MREEQYAGRIRKALNQGLQDISPASSRRLEAARHLALSRQKSPRPSSPWLGPAPSWFTFGHDHPYQRNLLSVIALLIGMWDRLLLAQPPVRQRNRRCRQRPSFRRPAPRGFPGQRFLRMAKRLNWKNSALRYPRPGHPGVGRTASDGSDRHATATHLVN